MRMKLGKTISAWIRPLRHWWKLLAGFWSIILLAVAINIGSSWLITKHTLWDISDTPLAWLFRSDITWVLAFILLFFTGLAFLAFAQDAKQTEALTTPSLHLSSALIQQNRKRMRQRLARWYKDFLDESLAQAAWLDLGLTDKPDALLTPVSLIVRDAHLPECSLPAGKSILQVYDEAYQELLILGEPGGGKSTLLYTLAQSLLQQTETDQTASLPVIFALSSWAQDQAPLEQWMAEQLVRFYQVPKLLAQQWVANQEILPLLDGLDEMEEPARLRCISAINTYHMAYPSSLVVCSRSAEYAVAAQTERLALLRAVVVQPLSTFQITEILKNGGKPLSGLHLAYKTNKALQELLPSPLLFNLFLLIYRGTTIRTLPTNAHALQQQVFEHYVQRMIARKGNTTRYPLEQTCHWLALLAQQMRSRSLTQFAIEDLQPDWLPQKFRLGYSWNSGLLVGLFFGLIFGLSVGLNFGLVIGLLVGVIFGLNFGLKFGRKQAIILIKHLQWVWSDALAGLFVGLFVGPIVGLLSGLLSGLLCALISALGLGLLGGLLDGLNPIQIIGDNSFFPGEGVNRSLKNGLNFGLTSGLVIGSLGSLIGDLHFGLSVGLSFGLSVGLLSGFSAFLQHYILRFWLKRSNLLPFHTITFFNDACARHLLKRVGGTYQFMHSLLQEYFAEQQKPL